MTFRHACPFCETDLTVPADAAGKTIQCTKCELGFVVPELVCDSPAPTAEPTPPAPSAPFGSPPAHSRLRAIAAGLVLVGLGEVSGFFLGRQFPPPEPVLAGPVVAGATSGHQTTAPRSGAPTVAVVKLPVAPAPRPVIPVRYVAPEPRAVWRPVRFVSGTAAGGGQIELRPDGSLVVTGPVADREQYTIVLDTDLPTVGALRLEALADPSLPGGGPGRAGNFVLNELRVATRPVGGAGEPVAVRLAGAEAPFSQDGCDVGAAIDGAPSTGWAVAPEIGRSHVAVFRFGAPAAGEKGVRLTVTMDQHYGGQHVLGRFRFSVAP